MRILLLSLAIAFNSSALAHAPSEHEKPSVKSPLARPSAATGKAGAQPYQPAPQPSGQPFCVRNSLGKLNCIYLPSSGH